jgi:hypothetical protein
MSKWKWLALVAAVAAVGLAVGCDDDDDDDADGGGTTSGSYAGVWSGRVCGRGLTMVISQNGNRLTGTYTFTDPTFSDSFSGTVSGEPPATARLDSNGHDWWFDLSFSSYNRMSGGFYKAEAGGKVCDVSATK